MNYRVDLILESEQRSASLISQKMLIRTLYVVLPVSVALMIASAVTNILMLKSECAQLEDTWKTRSPLAQKAVDIRADMNLHVDMQNELAGWKATHSRWSEELTMLQEAIPETIQLSSLLISQTIVPATPPTRKYTLTLEGKSIGDSAADRVQSLQSYLTTNDYFASRIKKVEIPLFEADRAAGASKTDRQFRLLCTYQERAFQ